MWSRMRSTHRSRNIARSSESHGFDDFFGVGPCSDGRLGGYTYDDVIPAAVASGRAPKARRSSPRATAVSGSQFRPSVLRHVCQFRPAGIQETRAGGRHPTTAIFFLTAPRRDLRRDLGRRARLRPRAASPSKRLDARRGAGLPGDIQDLLVARGRTRTGAASAAGPLFNCIR